MSNNFDTTWVSKIIKWVEEVTKFKLSDDIAESLKSGVILCRLIQQVEPGIIKLIDERDIPLAFVENINSYLKGCWKLGVASQDLFIASVRYLFNNL